MDARRRAHVARMAAWSRDDFLDRDEKTIASPRAADGYRAGDRIHASYARDGVFEGRVDDGLVGDGAAMRVVRLDPEALARVDLERRWERAVERIVGALAAEALHGYLSDRSASSPARNASA